jgi:hypothetical protein
LTAAIAFGGLPVLEWGDHDQANGAELESVDFLVRGSAATTRSGRAIGPVAIS